MATERPRFLVSPRSGRMSAPFTISHRFSHFPRKVSRGFPRGRRKELAVLCETGENIGSPSFSASLSHLVSLFCRNNEQSGTVSWILRWRGRRTETLPCTEGESLELRTKKKSNEEDEEAEEKKEKKRKEKVKCFR